MVHGLKYLGDSGEDARQAQHGETGIPCVNVNTLKGCRNVPIVDIATNEGFEQVKVIGDAHVALGILLDLNAVDTWASSQQLGQRITAGRRLGQAANEMAEKDALPEGFPEDASPAEIGTWAANDTKLVLPFDTAEDTRALIPEAVDANAESLGLDRSSTTFEHEMELKIAELEAKVVDLPQTYDEYLSDAVEAMAAAAETGEEGVVSDHVESRDDAVESVPADVTDSLAEGVPEVNPLGPAEPSEGGAAAAETGEEVVASDHVEMDLPRVEVELLVESWEPDVVAEGGPDVAESAPADFADNLAEGVPEVNPFGPAEPSGGGAPG